jgi:8-oxo-dGTP pyrophosphatase MutT (NUDIX family)
MSNRVRAAGGVVTIDAGERMIMLVTHRPHYDDWSFPKGKRDDGEDDLTCARREVMEETGISVVIHQELASVDYIDHKGRPKTVRYWHMTPDPQVHPGSQGSSPGSQPQPPRFVPNDEVDEVRWLTPAEARQLLSYDHDHALIDEVMRLNR